MGQKGTLTRLWARKGTRPRAIRDTRYQWAYLFGAVCPDRGIGAGLVMPYANTQAMNRHLEEIGKAISPGAHAALVFDGAGWHDSADLVMPKNITPIILPPYSPELNPVENVWEYLRKTSSPTAFHINYVTREGRHVRIVDKADFGKNPQGRFSHHVSWLQEVGNKNG